VNEPELWIVDTISGPGTTEELRQAWIKIWRAHPKVAESVRAEIEIAAHEIAANIVEHAGADQPVHMRMEVAVLPDEIQVRFIDDGRELKGSLDSVCLPDGMAERGRGLAVARAVLRNLSYQRMEDGNQWTLLSERFSG
jgi:serine/threonine-protein kinase RsbW